jgi:hypothetical protein
MMRWSGHVAGMGGKKKPERKRLLGRPRCRWEDDIKRDLKETGREDVDWYFLAQNRSVAGFCNTVMNF